MTLSRSVNVNRMEVALNYQTAWTTNTSMLLAFTVVVCYMINHITKPK